MKVAVLIPCYNEELTVEKVVSDFRQQLPEADIYVYDNNSKDRTGELALKAGAIVRKETQQGKGNVVRTMFREIDADCYVMVDGDDTYPAEEVHGLIKEVEEGADMVIGDRLSNGTYYAENKRGFHNLGNNLVRGLINRLFDNDIQDIMTGYRAFSKRFVKTIAVMSPGFEIETELTITALVYRTISPMSRSPTGTVRKDPLPNCHRLKTVSRSWSSSLTSGRTTVPYCSSLSSHWSS